MEKENNFHSELVKDYTKLIIHLESCLNWAKAQKKYHEDKLKDE